MTAKKTASAHTLGSDLKKVDIHRLKKHEYDELPELTDDMLARATINNGGRPSRMPIYTHEETNSPKRATLQSVTKKSAS